ncbi:MAG TPA: ABC transporter permease subunit, partial [Tepidisphaeraceae bacterium]|nr:ABC transporter permease subunit [Tepidisphaeraceae bacterium]
MQYVLDNLQWFIPAAIVLLGLVVYGFRDLLRFSIKRAWAISGVCFDESIRRRVLWITPLAILGVVLVTQFQRPSDEQDAIRQTTKFALFAAGMVVTITAIILACTNLPKEIESRVIYTIVTKPTTRLEIVVGKVIGFAKVSLTILLIMGLFTFGYLHFQAWRFQSSIAQRLASGSVDPATRSTYEYWAEKGLLGSQTFALPADLQIVAREPVLGDSRRYFYGGAEGDFIIPFSVTPDQLTPGGIPDARPGAAGVFIRLQVGFERSAYDPTPRPRSALPVGVAAPTDETSTTQPTQAGIGVRILNQNLETLVDSQLIQSNRPLMLNDPSGKTAVLIQISPENAELLAQSSRFFVNVFGVSNGVDYFVDARNDPDPLKNS